MADTIQGQQIINIGLPNQEQGSDSLYDAFTKTKTNFATLFACASPYTDFIAGNGISVTGNSVAGTLIIDNAGVLNITGGSGIDVDQSNGNVTISALVSSGTVTSVDVSPVSANRITTLGGPITDSGTISIDLATTGVVGGTYNNPTLIVDEYGRITTISSGPASSVAGSNTQVQFNANGGFGADSSFTFDAANGVLSVTHISGEAGNISNVAVSNIAGIGNIALVNLDGNTSNVLFGDGTFGSINSGVLPIQNGNSSIDIPSTDGNVSITAGGVDTWTFNIDGSLTLPGGNATFTTSLDAVTLASPESVQISRDDGNGNSSYVIAESGGAAVAAYNISQYTSLSVSPGGVDIGGTNPALSVSSGSIVAGTVRTTGLFYSALPSPAAGVRAFITDANLVAAGNFGAQVSGGGSNATPVYSDGVNWYIG